MRYFITGCTGLVGAYIAKEILEQGGNVKALKRVDSDLSFVKNIQTNIDWIEGDIFDTELLCEVIQETDFVIHSAGLVSFERRMKNQLVTTNVKGVANVVNACLLAPNLKKLCHISSIAALSPCKSGEVIDEKVKWKNEGIFSQYALSKHLGELEVWRGIEEGLRAVIVNPSMILGISDWNKSSSQLFKSIWKRNKIYMNVYINYVDSEDVAKIVYRLLHNPVKSERFIISAGYINYYNLSTQIAKIFGVSPPNISINIFWLKVITYIGDFINFFKKNTVSISKDMYKEIANGFNICDNTKICQLLDYKFKDLEETLANICLQIVKMNTRIF